MLKPKRKFPLLALLLVLAGLIVAALLIYQLPAVQRRLDWRITGVMAHLRGAIDPVRPMPTSADAASLPTQAPTASLTPTVTPVPSQPTPTTPPTATVTPSPTPLPPSIALPAPKYEVEDWNSCGPATLTMYLRFYGWEGTQTDISKVVKPVRQDRNVNVDELIYYVRMYAGWLNAEFRVGGDMTRLKSFLAAGIPVMIEGGTVLDVSWWPGDDKWAGHYLLITGYDEASQVFYIQDSFRPEVKTAPYQALDKEWQIFNRVYILVYPPSQEENVKNLLGADWSMDASRQHALETAQAETQSDPSNAFAWFNLGSNQVYFERYGEASTAYDMAIKLGLPQRMLLYQFGPFFAYFHSDRIDDLLAISGYVLNLPSHPLSEEPYLWHGWGLYRKDDVQGAIADWRKALEANPNYQDALYALDYVGASP